jgi:hypothetical protein
MQSIADNVHIEDHYLGVTLGVIQQARGLIQIDAPPSPEDSRSWRAALMSLSGGPERVLLMLDAHPDRTLGASRHGVHGHCPGKDRAGIPNPTHHVQGPGHGDRCGLGDNPRFGNSEMGCP